MLPKESHLAVTNYWIPEREEEEIDPTSSDEESR